MLWVLLHIRSPYSQRTTSTHNTYAGWGDNSGQVAVQAPAWWGLSNTNDRSHISHGNESWMCIRWAESENLPTYTTGPSLFDLSTSFRTCTSLAKCSISSYLVKFLSSFSLTRFFNVSDLWQCHARLFLKYQSLEQFLLALYVVYPLDLKQALVPILYFHVSMQFSIVLM